jgi:hypothetical protein
MTSTEATAEVFWTAFLAMSKRERQAFLERLLSDARMREDLLDAVLIEERKGEPTRPLGQVIAEIEQGGRKRRR